MERFLDAPARKEDYQIIALIGQGAFGHVYKGRKKGTSQVVALKTINKRGKSEKEMVNIRSEIDILRKLRHENIILLIDSFETSSEFVMVTELGHAQLYSIIEDDKALNEHEIRKVSRQLVHALHYLHSHRVAHRDMKPQNILISTGGIVKLCDFGFARSMSYRTQVLTSLKGTPLYMAPQVLQEKDYDQSADLWSLGVIIYELYTGSPPFMSNHIYSLVEHIINDPIRYPDGISSDFKSFLKGLLNKDPKDRIGWPALLQHSFIRETEEQAAVRAQRLIVYNKWADQSVQQQKEEEFTRRHVNRMHSTHKTFSPNKEKKLYGDELWQKFQNLAQEERTATQLRVDNKFLEKLISLLGTSVTDLLRDKAKRLNLQIGLRTLSTVLIKTHRPESSAKDILKQPNLLAQLLSVLKGLVKIENGKNFIELLVELVKAIGLITKANFTRYGGLELAVMRSFMPQIGGLVKSSINGEGHGDLALNLAKTIGIVSVNASSNVIKSYNFYKELIDSKFPQDCVILFKNFDSGEIRRCLLQMIVVIVHPLFGDVVTFPWKRSISPVVAEFNQCQPILQSIKQTFANALLEFDWAGMLNKIYLSEEDLPTHTRAAVLRLLLQLSRASQNFSQRLLNEKLIVKIIMRNLKQDNGSLFCLSAILLCNISSHISTTFKTELAQLLSCIQSKIFNQKNPLCQLYALAFMQEFFLEGLAKLDPGSLFRVFNQLLIYHRVNKVEEISKIEGSGYGVIPYAFNDWILQALGKLLLKAERSVKEMAKIVAESGLEETLYRILVDLNSRNDISPRGMVAFLMVSLELCLSETTFGLKVLRGVGLTQLFSFMSESQVLSVQEWPQGLHGGGPACLHLMTVNLLKLLSLSLQLYDQANCFWEQEAVFLIINSLKHLQNQQLNLGITLLSRLIALSTESRPFAEQFVSENGMALFANHGLLNPDMPIQLLMESLTLLSNLARHSANLYPSLLSIPISDLHRLMQHPECYVRAKVCNLLGNMCKHSPYFYSSIKSSGITRQVIASCSDPDPGLRKFACFALGNMAFYSDELYGELKRAIPSLVKLLSDGQERTRSNSAGAIGNLVRNSGSMSEEIIRSGAIQKLKQVVESDSSQNVVKVAYYSLTNISNSDDALRVISDSGLQVLLRKHMVVFEREPVVIKCLNRLAERMQQAI